MLLSLSFVFIEWFIMQTLHNSMQVSAQCYALHLHRLCRMPAQASTI